MTHELTITHDQRVFARAWGVVCKNCSFRAAAASEDEAKRSEQIQGQQMPAYRRSFCGTALVKKTP